MFLSATLLLGAALPVCAGADPDPAADTKPLVEKQQALLRQYKAVAEDLLSLAHRLEKSDKLEDKEKAKLIRKAIELADKEGVDTRFQALLRTIAGGTGLKDITSARDQNEELVRILKSLFTMLCQGDELPRIQAERARLEKLLAELRAVIRATKVNRVLTESEKGGGERLAREQDGVGGRTERLAGHMDEQKSPGTGHVKQAVPDQFEAGKRIRDEQRPLAVVKQTDAIVKLHKAQDELEKRLRQLREEELERLLAGLEARVAKMLQMQIEVREATVAIDAIVQKGMSGKPEKAEIQKAQVQADKESEIIAGGRAVVEILRSEGSAVAFPRVFEEAVVDMNRIKERLNLARTGEDTQFLEQQVIDALREILETLKRAQRPPGGAPPGPPGDPDPRPADQPLLEQVAELKMLRNLQLRLNERTRREGERCRGGEQTDDVQGKQELKDLANRQQMIEAMTHDLALGRNK
jgi:hypothetical protein